MTARPFNLLDFTERQESMLNYFIAVYNPSRETLDMLNKEAKRTNAHINATSAHFKPPSVLESEYMKVKVIEKDNPDVDV